MRVRANLVAKFYWASRLRAAILRRWRNITDRGALVRIVLVTTVMILLASGAMGRAIEIYTPTLKFLHVEPGQVEKWFREVHRGALIHTFGVGFDTRKMRTHCFQKEGVFAFNDNGLGFTHTSEKTDFQQMTVLNADTKVATLTIERDGCRFTLTVMREFYIDGSWVKSDFPE